MDDYVIELNLKFEDCTLQPNSDLWDSKIRIGAAELRCPAQLATGHERLAGQGRRAR